MSAGSPKFTVNRVVALSLISLWLAGCSSSNNAPAPVSTVNSNGSGSTSSGMPSETGLAASVAGSPQKGQIRVPDSSMQPHFLQIMIDPFFLT